MIEVKFSIDLIVNNQVQILSEDIISTIKDDSIELLKQQEVIIGSIEIKVSDQEQLIVSDELWAAVQNICFECITAIFDGKKENYLYRFTEYEGHINLIPDGNKIRIISENAPMVTAPANELFTALYKCGKRFIAFLKIIEGNDGPIVSYLEPFAERAKLSLIKHGVESV